MHRGFAAGIHVPQDNHPLCQQANRPAVAASRCLAAGQRDQMRLGHAVKLAHLARPTIAVFQDPLQSALHQTPAKPLGFLSKRFLFLPQTLHFPGAGRGVRLGGCLFQPLAKVFLAADQIGQIGLGLAEFPHESGQLVELHRQITQLLGTVRNRLRDVASLSVREIGETTTLIRKDVDLALSLAPRRFDSSLFSLIETLRAVSGPAEVDRFYQGGVELKSLRTKALHAKGKSKEVLTVDNHADGPYLYMRMLRENPERAKDVLELLQMNEGNNSGRGIGCISWDGEVYADQFWRHYSFGNVKDRPFSEIWTDLSDPLMKKLKWAR